MCVTDYSFCNGRVSLALADWPGSALALGAACGAARSAAWRMADQESGALQLTLHPLVIINISDHFTRGRCQTSSPSPRVFGALIGAQSGRHIEIANSFEVKVVEAGARAAPELSRLPASRRGPTAHRARGISRRLRHACWAGGPRGGLPADAAGAVQEDLPPVRDDRLVLHRRGAPRGRPHHSSGAVRGGGQPALLDSRSGPRSRGDGARAAGDHLRVGGARRRRQARDALRRRAV